MTHASFTPVLDAYRFYEDGTESGATAAANQNTALSRNVDTNSNLQVRVRLQETGGTDGATTDDYVLFVSRNGGTAIAVTNVNPFIIPNTGSALTDGGATTNRLGAGTGSFVAGEQEDQNGIVEDYQLTLSNYTEHVWGVTLLAAGLANGDALAFSVQLNGAATTSNVTPTINVTKSSSIASGDGSATGAGTASGVGEDLVIVTGAGASDGAATATAGGAKLPTAVAAVNTNATLSVNTTYLLRVRIENSGDSGDTDFRWLYNHNSGGFTTVTTTSTHVKAISAASFTDGVDVPERLGGTGTYIADNNAATHDGTFSLTSAMAAGGAFEAVLSFQLDAANVSDAETGQIRPQVFHGGQWVDLDAYTNTLTYTVSEAAGGIVSGDGLANGVATVAGVGRATAGGAGASDGASSVFAIGIAIASAVGASNGISTAHATSSAAGAAPGDGLATGTSTAAAVGMGIASAVGASNGAATAAATGLGVAGDRGEPFDDGFFFDDAFGWTPAVPVYAAGAGLSNGAATADAIGSSIAAAVGLSGGVCTSGAGGAVLEPVLPNAILASTNLRDTDLVSPPVRLLDIQDDPDAPDANWFTAIVPTSDTVLRLGLANAPGNLAAAQAFELYVRKTGSGTPTVDIELWESGSLVQILVMGVQVTSLVGQKIVVSWDPSVITNPANAEIRIFGMAA